MKLHLHAYSSSKKQKNISIRIDKRIIDFFTTDYRLDRFRLKSIKNKIDITSVYYWLGRGYHAILYSMIRLFSLYGNVKLVCILNWCASHIEFVIACTPGY